ncbi:MAG: hypothetical protein HQL37_14635 [Alphaproteobacteria bacterium]|nr:hypothetical protein [Alphaproteobacteria bacterium]
MGDLGYGVNVNTSKSVEMLEKWLDKNCAGKWTLQIDDVSPDLKKKKVSIFFEVAVERDAFKKYYTTIPG